MIIKSMSRKEPSFSQLMEYIDREAGQEAFTIRRNLYGRDHHSIRSEFEANAELLQKRKNGVYLFHEILSITRARGLSAEEQKQRLYDITSEYIKARCPENLVYGGMHQDKDHSYHMHLIISANKAGDLKRQRLNKHQFREIQVKLEAHVLKTYPELEQKLAIGKRSENGRNKGEVEMERRTGKRPKLEEILERIKNAYNLSADRESLISALRQERLDLYIRGSTIGVVDLDEGKKHRLKTLDPKIADEIENRLSGKEPRLKHEAEKPHEAQRNSETDPILKNKEKAHSEQKPPEPQKTAPDNQTEIQNARKRDIKNIRQSSAKSGERTHTDEKGKER